MMKISDEALEYMQSIIEKFKPQAIEEAYKAGYDCGKNGATIKNCSPNLFGSWEHVNAWNQGKSDGESNKPNAYET